MKLRSLSFALLNASVALACFACGCSSSSGSFDVVYGWSDENSASPTANSDAGEAANDRAIESRSDWDGGLDAAQDADASDVADASDAGPTFGIPTITTAVTSSGTAVASSGTAPSFVVNAQNAPLTSTIAVASNSLPGTYLCVSTADTTPTCSSASLSGCASGADTKIVSSGTRNITTDATVIYAVACAPGLSTLLQSDTESVTYHLNVTPITSGTAASACGGTTDVGFDTSSSALAQDVNEGGPTVGAMLCYGAVAYDCNSAIPNGVTCFVPSSGAYRQTVVVSTPTLYAVTCPPNGLVGQNSGTHPSTVQSQTETGVSAHAKTITITNAFPGGWDSSNRFESTSALITGGFDHDATNVYFEADGFAPSNSTDVVIFLSDGTSANAMSTAPAALSPSGIPTQLPFSAQLAIDYETTSSTVRNIYANDGTSWSVVTPADWSSAQVVVSNVIQASIPIAVLPSSTSGVIDVAGEIITGAGGSVNVVATWPFDGAAWMYVSDVLVSCETPVSDVE